jgi:polyisoprenoid-binding protein YceI
MKNQITTALLTLSVAALVGCSNPADNVAEAEVNEPTQAAAPASPETAAPASEPAPVADAKAFVISADSKIDFLASKAIGGETPGGFKKFTGQFNVAAGTLAPEGSKIVIEIDSIWTKVDKLTAHLKNEDFFNVEKIPTATFAATKIESMPEDSTKQKLTGDFTMHGITKSISFPATITVTDESVALKADFFINRFDFDMKFPGQPDNLIRKEVVIKLDVKATPGEAAVKAL